MACPLIQSNLANLPTELLLEIFSLLDDCSLMSLAQVSRRFNRLSICGFKHHWQGFAHYPDIGYAGFTMPELRAEFRRFIFISVTFRLLAVRFSSSPTRLREELSLINQTISNQASIDNLTLEIPPVLGTQSGSMGMWWNTLAGVVESALGRGCKGLKLDITIAPRTRTMQCDSELQLSVQHRQNKLRKLEISGGLLLEPPFIQWTLDLLSCSPIYSLDFNQISQTPETWSRLLVSSDLHCPNLQNLNIYCEIPWADLKVFLARHSSLQKLAIVPDQIKWRDQPFEITSPLGALWILRLHPAYGACLLPPTRPDNQLWSCTLVFVPSSVDIGSVVLTLKNLSDGNYISSTGHICLHNLTEKTISDLLAWLQNPLNKSLPRSSFPHICHLRIQFDGDFVPNRPGFIKLKQLCSFFPELRILHVGSPLYDKWDGKWMDPFWSEMVKACPVFEKGTAGTGWSTSKEVFLRKLI